MYRHYFDFFEYPDWFSQNATNLLPWSLEIIQFLWINLRIEVLKSEKNLALISSSLAKVLSRCGSHHGANVGGCGCLIEIVQSTSM